MDGAMGKEDDVVEAVLTCEGDFHDPELQNQIERFRHKLKDLLLTDSREVQVRKVEPWNSVKVTLTIPREAAVRLRQLAQNGSEALRQLGVLSVQVQGDSQIALTFLGSNNEHREVVLSSSPAPQVPPVSAAGSAVPRQVSNPSPAEAVVSLDDMASSPGPSSDEVTRKNIVHYLKQDPHLRQNAALIGSLMGAVGAVSSASSSPRFGMSQDMPTVLNPVTSTIGMKAHSYRPKNVAVGEAAAHHQGSQVAKNFPLKATGAFHPPVPRLPPSAGQSMAVMNSASSSSSSYQLQQQTNSMNPPIVQSAAICQHSAASGTSQHGLASNMSNFNSLGPHIHPSGLNSSNFISTAPVVPSSSSSSNYFADLPPPPPYPHGSNSAASSRANKQGNASSPMLVNLLQTDPSVAAAGMASGNPNKPLTMGDPAVSDSPPKKKRKRKPKSGLAKTSPNEVASSQNDSPLGPMIPQTMDSTTNPLRMEQINVAADIPKSLNTKLDSSAAFGLLRDNKVSLAQCYPGTDSNKDGFTSSGIQSDLGKSAIVARTNSSLAESTRQLPQQRADVFSPEIAAGKIINPYTGKLEPRDSVVDSGMRGVKDSGMTQGSGYSATQMLARRAFELDEIAQKSVPQSSSALLENVNAAQNISTSTLNLVSLTSTTTAAASSVNSAELSQISNTKTQRFDFSSNKTAASVKGSLTPSIVYAGSSNLCQNIPTIQTSIESQPSLPKISFPIDAANKVASRGLSNGPLPSDIDTGGQMRKAHLDMNSKLVASGVSSSSLDSLINSHLKVSLHCTASQANFSQAPSIQHQIGGVGNQVRTVSVTASHSSLSLSVSLDNPSAQTRLSSPVTVAEQAKSSALDNAQFTHHRQAAIPNADSKMQLSTPVTSPSLLNSVQEKHIDSLSSTESPPDSKVLSEGDENPYSGVVPDSGPEHSGTVALIEHSRVKIENHDSGIGSSSERSDDTPSEPGDGEFRPGHPSTEAEDSNTKVSLSQKLLDCKPDPSLVSASSSITVGYMMNSSGDNSVKLSSSSKGAVKRPSVVPVSSAESSGSDISQFYDAHCKSMEKQAGLMAVEQVSLSSNWLSEKAGAGYHPQHGSKIKENGPSTSNLSENRAASPKLNGPSSQGSLSSMVATMNELHAKKLRLSPKQGGINNKGMADSLKEEQQVKEAVMEKFNRFHPLQDQKDSFPLSPSGLQEMKSTDVITDKAQRDMSLSHRLEGHTEQLFLDLEEMQMKMMGNGTAVVAGGGAAGEGKGGNITSIYSKRSSPVNVNMLNHIYASGLPLPRRLTESVQRLVKPLPASEMGMSLSLPQSRAYNSKSPVSSSVGALPPKVVPTIMSSTNGPHHPARMANHSGARSPGASIPRLIPNDQHHRLSGGLDLAGLSSFQIPLAYGADAVSVGGASGGGGQMPALPCPIVREDFVVKGEPHSLSLNLHSSPNLLRDSQPYSNKMLSQSYPPFKTKDHLANVMQRNHDFQVNLNSSKSNEVVQHSFNDSKSDSVSDLQDKANLQFSAFSYHSFVESKESRVPNQQGAEETDSHHSNKHADGSEPQNLSFSSCSSSSVTTVVHSNASSPLMPILQRGQEPPITPTFPSNMPSISSQPPLISLATSTEISSSQENTSGKPTAAFATLTQFQSVVPSSNSLSTMTSLEKPKGNVVASVMETTPSRLPILSLAASSPTPSLVGSTDLPKVHAKSSAESTQDQSSCINDRSDPPKLTKALPVTGSSSVSSKAISSSTNSYQFSRNIFDTVSAQPLTKQPNAAAFASLGPKIAGIDHELQSPCADKLKTCDSSLPAQSRVSDHNIDTDHKSVAKSSEGFHKSNSENGSKQHSSFNQYCSESESSKSVKSRHLPSLAVPFSTSEQKRIASSENLQGVYTLSEGEKASSSTSSNWSVQALHSTAVAPVKGILHTPNVSLPNSSSVFSETLVTEASKPQLTTSTISSSLSVSADSSSAVVAVIDNGDASTSQSTSDGGEPSNSSIPVKEPILETLASALKQNQEPSSQSSANSLEHQTKPSEKSPALQRPPMAPLSASDISKLEQSMVLQGKMVSVQSSSQLKSLTTEQSSSAVSEVADAGSSHSRVTRKRKINSLEGESSDAEGSTTSTKATPQKPATVGSHSKSKPSESLSNRMEKTNVKDTGSIDSGPTLIKAATNSTEKGEIMKATTEHKDAAAKISADLEKSQERRRHRSITSSSQSDDGHSHRSSSNESRDSTSPSHRDGRSNRTSGISTPDKDGRHHRSSGNTSGAGQHREVKPLHRVYPDGQSKENRSHRVPGHHSSEDARHTLVDWSEDHSGDDKDKIKMSVGKPLPPGEKLSSPDDGQKKGHRVRRQFYAYVPEKSLDQTYFDTPILSGRTRSKNKPSEEETAAGTGTASTPSLGDAHAPSSVAHIAASSTITLTGHSMGVSKHADQGAAANPDVPGTGGKRSTRSVRTKDASQDQNSNKRRKVQQQR